MVNLHVYIYTLRAFLHSIALHRCISTHNEISDEIIDRINWNLNNFIHMP